MRKQKILLVDDNPSVVVVLQDQLEYFGYDVSIARNGKQALEHVSNSKPDLILLDVMMPELDGYEVCSQLKSSHHTTSIPILMLSAKGQTDDTVKGLHVGADDYISKPHDKDELDARIKALLRRTRSYPYDSTNASLCTVKLMINPGDRSNIRVKGQTTLNDTTVLPCILDQEVFSRHAENMRQLDWRFNSKVVGRQLYKQMISEHDEILSGYKHAQGTVSFDKQLHLELETRNDLLRVPFEALFEGNETNGEYLVLRHPLSRNLSGVSVRRPSLSPTSLNQLWSNGEALQILLIGSNTSPNIPGVDQEIDTLQENLQIIFAQHRIDTELTVIPTVSSEYNQIRNTIRNSKYHIIHYAGHGTFNQNSPEKSYLSFWEKPNKRGKVVEMPVTDLQFLLSGSDVRFMYLSCCWGTSTGGESDFLDDDFLGIADGVIQAGVPSVIGYRWPVSDAGAVKMALSFYQSFAEQGRLDTALHYARNEVASQDRDDITWLSPVLIMQ